VPRDEVRGVLGQQAEVALAGAQCLLGLMTLRDVEQDDHHAVGFPVVVGDGHRVDGMAATLELEVEGTWLAREHRAVLRDQLLAPCVRHHLGERAARDRVRAPTPRLERRPLGELEAQLAIEDQHPAARQVAQDGAA
jgi:hypothetical protein